LLWQLPYGKKLFGLRKKLCALPGLCRNQRLLLFATDVEGVFRYVPSKALRPMPITDGLANFETPYIIPRRNRCDLCLVCQEVCPTGAISRIPLEKVRMGTIDKYRIHFYKSFYVQFPKGKFCLRRGV
jgi:ferredoxin